MQKALENEDWNNDQKQAQFQIQTQTKIKLQVLGMVIWKIIMMIILMKKEKIKMEKMTRKIQ